MWASWAGDRLFVLPGQWDAFWNGRVPGVFQEIAVLAAEAVACGGLAAYLQGHMLYKCVYRPPSLPEIQSKSMQSDWGRFGGVSLCHFDAP